MRAQSLTMIIVLLGLTPGGVSLGAPPSTTKDEKPAKKDKEIVNSIKMKLCYIPPGKFLMGTAKAEIERLKKEPMGQLFENPDMLEAQGPQHEVEITKGFYLGKYEVTQGEFKAVMSKNPSWFSAKGGGSDEVRGKDTERFPVEQVSWEDAKEFCRKLTEKERKAGQLGQDEEYRLPREAEWEYGARGGAKTDQAFHYGDSLSSRQANFNGEFPFRGGEKAPPLKRTTDVGSYKENAFGLHDMHGNVWEWCEDRYGQFPAKPGKLKDPRGPSEGTARVRRGGSWIDFAGRCRSAFRFGDQPTSCVSGVGFRIARAAVE